MPRIRLAESVPEDLDELFAAATKGRRPLLNLHTQMVSAPFVLAADVGIRRAIEAHGTLDLRTRFAARLAVSAETGCECTQAVNRVLTARAGMPPEHIGAVLANDAGVTDAQLAEAYASIGLAMYVDQFFNYADTPFEVPAFAARAAWRSVTAMDGLPVIQIIIASTRCQRHGGPIAAWFAGVAAGRDDLVEAQAMLDDLVWWATTLPGARAIAAVA